MDTTPEEDRELQRYRWAGTLARHAMGRGRRMRGDAEAPWNADDDPLAWWLLTEMLMKGIGP